MGNVLPINTLWLTINIDDNVNWKKIKDQNVLFLTSAVNRKIEEKFQV